MKKKINNLTPKELRVERESLLIRNRVLLEENKRLEEECERYKEGYTARGEAIDELQERVKVLTVHNQMNKSSISATLSLNRIYVEWIDKLLKMI